MKTIEVSESALESLKAMAQKLQEERDMLLGVVETFRQRFHCLPSARMGVQMSDAQLYNYAKDAIAACQESTKVLE